ncbi:MAG: mercuric transporter MerT family protein [Arcobacteraceae bacterium]
MQKLSHMSIYHKKEYEINRNFQITGAVITALLSTLCCLPAFLFLFFGISSGALTILTQLEFLRLPLALLTVLFFFLWVRKRKKEIVCACNEKKQSKQIILYITFFLIIVGLLLYPEIIPLFME